MYTIEIDLPISENEVQTFTVEADFRAGRHSVDCIHWELDADFTPNDEQAYLIDRAILSYIEDNQLHILESADLNDGDKMRDALLEIDEQV